MTSKEFVHNLATDLGLKPRWKVRASVKLQYGPGGLMRYHKSGFYYSFVISGDSTKVAIWKIWKSRSAAPAGFTDRERMAVNLCDPGSIEKIKSFIQ